jgi:hypothetical protein
MSRAGSAGKHAITRVGLGRGEPDKGQPRLAPPGNAPVAMASATRRRRAARTDPIMAAGRTMVRSKERRPLRSSVRSSAHR